MSVRTPEGFVRKSTWQVAVVRRPWVSASHIIQAGNDLFIGKNEAYIMNRKKEEKSVLRKGATCTSSTLFVKVPAGAPAPADLMTKTQLGPNVTESMSVVADPVTYGIELANCPWTAAVLGELATQWQQMMGPCSDSNKRP